MTITVDGQEKRGERVPYEVVDEPWTKYRLPDGTIVRLRLIATDVVRLDHDLPSGESHYMVESGNIMAVDVLEPSSEVH